MPSLMSRLRRLDHAVGVEQQRVARRHGAGRARGTSASVDQAEHRALGSMHRPAARAGGALRGRRVAGGADLELRRCRGRARGGPRWRSPRPSPAAAGSRWPPAGSRRAAARRAGRRRHRTAAARGCRRPRPCRTRRRRRPRAGRRCRDGRRRSRRRTACRRPSAARTRACQPSGRSGLPPWLRIRSRRSTSIDSPCVPPTPRRERRNEVSRTMKPSDEEDQRPRATVRRLIGVLLRDRRSRPAPARRPRTTAAGAGRAPGCRAAAGPSASMSGAVPGQTMIAPDHQQREDDEHAGIARLRRDSRRRMPLQVRRTRVGPTERSAAREVVMVLGVLAIGWLTVRRANGTWAGIGDTRTGCVRRAPRSRTGRRRRGTAWPLRR